MTALSLTGLKIWDGCADGYLPAANVLVLEGANITEVGSEARGASQDCSGLYALPGLIDAHIHLVLDPSIGAALDQGQESEHQLTLKMEQRVAAMAAAGITSARDLGGGAWQELAIRDRIARGELVGPRLICAGQPITSPGGHCHFWGGEASTVEQCDQVIDRQLARGVDLIKVMATGGSMTPQSRPIDSQFDLATLRHIVQRAAAEQRPVAAHCHGSQGIHDAAAAGVATIEHCSFVGPQGWGHNYDEPAVAHMLSNGTAVSPTVNSGWRRFIDGPGEALRRDNLDRLRRAGIVLIASTDAGIPNIAHHDLPRALPVFAHFAGFSAVQCLRAATSHCAQAIGLGAVTGQLRAGFEADIVLYEQDPLADLSALERPVAVYGRGRLLYG